jgi:hypothetical protein
MISHCANPDCVAPFEGGGGRFFRFPRDRSKRGGAWANSHAVEHFWLCPRCAGVYTLEDLGDRVSVRVRPSIAELESVT